MMDELYDPVNQNDMQFGDWHSHHSNYHHDGMSDGRWSDGAEDTHFLEEPHDEWLGSKLRKGAATPLMQFGDETEQLKDRRYDNTLHRTSHSDHIEQAQHGDDGTRSSDEQNTALDLEPAVKNGSHHDKVEHQAGGLSDKEEEELIKETIAENPAEERGVRPEWVKEEEMRSKWKHDSASVPYNNRVTIKQLREYMRQNGVSCTHCSEKQHLIDAIADHRNKDHGIGNKKLIENVEQHPQATSAVEDGAAAHETGATYHKETVVAMY